MTNEDKILNVAFWGGGINSAVGFAHYSAINIDNIYNLVTGCFSKNADTNLKSGIYYKINPDRIYDNIESLIVHEKQNIDAIIILTPTNQHATQVLKMLENNIPVVCEKTLANSCSEIEEIKKVLEKNHGFLTVIYNYLGYPMIRELKNLISKKKLGKIKHIQVEMPQEGFIRQDENKNPVIPQQWRLQDINVPTISLDLGVHLHMLIKYLTNEIPVKVVAKSESLGNFSSIIDNVNCIIEYSNNISCNMWFSKIAIGNRNGMKIRIYGDKAAAEWVQEYPEILNLADNFGNRWKIDRGNLDIDIANKQRYTRFKVGHPAGYIEAFANYYHDIANALLYYKQNKSVNFVDCFGIDESYEGIKLFEAIQNSSLSETWVKIDLY